MLSRTRHRFNFKRFITVYVFAAAMDLLVWLIFSGSYRSAIAELGESYPWGTDILITLAEAFFLLTVGICLGRSVMARLVDGPKSVWKPVLWSAAVFVIIYLSALLVSYLWDALIYYYSVTDRQLTVVFLGSLSSFFVMAYLMDDFSELVRQKEREIAETELKRRLEEEESRRAQDQIIAGRYSDNHFILNSLSVLYRMLETGDPDVKGFAKDLISCTKYLSTSAFGNTIPIERELDNLKRYLSLLHKRHGDALRLTIDESVEGADCDVVPMSVTSLAENAAKHNAFSGSDPLEILITYSEGFIVVSNRIKARQGDAEGLGSGLDLLKRQYSLLTDRPVDIINDGEHFTVRLPAITY